MYIINPVLEWIIGSLMIVFIIAVIAFITIMGIDIWRNK